MDVKRFNGVAVVQDPEEAMFPSMPASAVENVQVDHVLRLDEIGALLARLAREPVPAAEGAAFMATNNRGDERDIAELGTDDLKTRNMDGPPSRFTCPECGGALWELENGKVLRYRCHVGHGYTAETLMEAQATRLEDAMWAALRALEETAGMRRRMATRAEQGGWTLMAENYGQQAQHAETRAGLIRSVLLEENPQQVNANSARQAEQEAAEATDPNAGRMAPRQPRAPVPGGSPKPPRSPETKTSRPAADQPQGKSKNKPSGGAHRTSRKPR
jgi:two-component system chemotaxis response regulator CheB